MYVLTTEEMASIDKRAISEFGISGEVLMENAGRTVADRIEKNFGDVDGKKVLIVCGKGNNGGDGYVIARHLYEKGAQVYVLMCADREEIHGDAKTMLEKIPDNVRFTTEERANDNHFDVVVDAVFGTGFKGEIDGIYKRVIKLINKCAGMVVSVDIPSGVNGNTGMVAEACVKADYTFTFCCEKLGHRIYPGKGMCGKTVICDIGIPERAVAAQQPKMQIFTKSDMEGQLRPLSPMDHKGNNGKLLIIGGSVGMSGAVCLSAMAALRTGVGLCYVAVPKSLYSIIATKLTEAIIIPLDEGDDGSISVESVESLEQKLLGVDAVVVGGGMSVTQNTYSFMNELMGKLKIPTLIDADGLNIISKNLDCLSSCDAPIVITPHMMEMSRLSKLTIDELQNDRVNTAIKFSTDNKVTTVLKGDGTITTNGARGYINSSGNPGMATAGSGDVLAGIIGALMAGGMEPFNSAACGAYIHGLAGDYAAIQYSMRSMIASDIISNLPNCFNNAIYGKATTSILEKRIIGKGSGITKLG